MVIGSGFGGTMAAHELVHAGLDVLMLERGDWVARGLHNWDDTGSVDLTPFFSQEAPYRVAAGGNGPTLGSYSCVGGPSVFYGDIAFYSGEWDARERVGRIDTNRCRLFMLTGEYDYSCTVELSQATAAKIPGVVFREMKGIGHFPFAENPRLFAGYLLPVLRDLEQPKND